LDLVAVDPAGELAAFCIGWFTPHGRGGLPSAQIEPFGVREDLQRRGLGRALLAECLQRMVALGAQHIAVETDNYRDAAYQFYESLGFVVERRIVVYRNRYTSSDQITP
jgi:mycothiol synthase